MPKIQVDALRLDKFIGLLEVVLVGFETLVSFVFSGIVSFVGLVVLWLLVLFSGMVTLVGLVVLGLLVLFSGMVTLVGLVALVVLVVFSGVVWLIELEILVSLLFSGIVSFVEFPMHVLF